MHIEELNQARLAELEYAMHMRCVEGRTLM